LDSSEQIDFAFWIYECVTSQGMRDWIWRKFCKKTLPVLFYSGRKTKLAARHGINHPMKMRYFVSLFRDQKQSPPTGESDQE